jgi:cation transporter-like permease
MKLNEYSMCIYCVVVFALHPESYDDSVCKGGMTRIMLIIVAMLDVLTMFLAIIGIVFTSLINRGSPHPIILLRLYIVDYVIRAVITTVSIVLAVVMSYVIYRTSCVSGLTCNTDILEY